MKNMVVSLALFLATTTAFAKTDFAKVCSTNSEGKLSVTEFAVDGRKVTMMVDGTLLEYELISKVGVNLKRASAVAGERVIEATQYVISSPQGVSTLQIAIGASGAQYMLFMQNGIMGASSNICN